MEGDEVADERASAAEAVVAVREENPDVPSSSCTAINPGETQPSAAAAAPAEILRALEVVERDSSAIVESYASLFSSLRLSLSEVTRTSHENMQCFNDVVGRLQESALDAATKGSRYINSCLRLNEEMKDLESVAIQLYPSSFRPVYIINIKLDGMTLALLLPGSKTASHLVRIILLPIGSLNRLLDASDFDIS